MTRTQGSIKNIYSSFINEILNIILKFVVRTIFIYSLGLEFLGFNSLMINIIAVLSLTELGFGTAITYHLYKPISIKDYNKLSYLLFIFKKVYTYIGILVLIIGLALLPFITTIVNMNIDSLYIIIVYLLYLFQTVSSYFFYAYKHTLIRAYQKEFVINNKRSFFNSIGSLLQILTIIIFNNFYLFVVVIKY
jgi:O-antigen/teichoic acid export membrane protein